MAIMQMARKLGILADAAKYDASCASGGAGGRKGRLPVAGGTGICHSHTPDGRCISLLKVLLTNWCIYDCLYCVNRRSSNTPRARFQPAELADLVIGLFQRNCIEGLFLSSGIFRSPDHTMEQMLQVLRLLRHDRVFAGYIHVKAIPNCDPALVAEAAALADRISINLELPTEQGLKQLAPEKPAAPIHAAMGSLRRLLEEHSDAPAPSRPAPAGQSTQIIVGADQADDRRILTVSDGLYRRHRLRRVYYSAFSPIPSAAAALPVAPPPLAREHRLYQADWLLRRYEFSLQDLTGPQGALDRDGLLSLDLDPKSAWALANRGLFPLDPNKADRQLLLRVPGLGVKVVDRILAARRWRRLDLAGLKALGAQLSRARPFLDLGPGSGSAASLDSEGLATMLSTGPRQLALF